MSSFTGIASALALSFVATASLAADETTVGDIRLGNPFTFETSKLAKAGGAYVTITNLSNAPDTLVGASGDFPKVEIHTVIEDNGVTKMRPVEAIEIAAGATVALEPGGYHIMLMGIPAPFEVGDTVQATLIFENAGAVDVIFPVKSRDAHNSGHAHGH